MSRLTAAAMAFLGWLVLLAIGAGASGSVALLEPKVGAALAVLPTFLIAPLLGWLAVQWIKRRSPG